MSQCVLPRMLLASSADFDSALWPGASSPGAMQSSYAGFSVPPAHVMCCCLNAREESCSFCKVLYLFASAAQRERWIKGSLYSSYSTCSPLLR